MAKAKEAAHESSAETATQALAELTPATASIGIWLVRVHKDAKVIPYSYVWKGEKKDAKKVEVVLIGTQAETYCLGRARRSPNAKDDTALQAIASKFKGGTMWKMSAVGLMNENKAHLGCSVKVVVDLAKTTWSPVLQSTVKMPKQPAPPGDLATLLSCPEGQVVDVIALVTNVSQPARKSDLVHVTIMDDSGTNGAASCKFPA